MGVAEGRQIAFDELHELWPMTYDEALARNDEVSRRMVKGPSGRSYKIQVSFYDEPDEPGPPCGMYVEVKVSRADLPISFKECVYLDRDGLDDDVAADSPMTRWEEVKERAVMTGCGIALAPLMLLVLILVWVLSLFDEKVLDPDD
ncbi:MAG: hypothetical protein J0H98_07435 [Solirubrobacterales bacterium]|nr:hypothetical protein [Solirubrobacterales bacterium]